MGSSEGTQVVYSEIPTSFNGNISRPTDQCVFFLPEVYRETRYYHHRVYVVSAIKCPAFKIDVEVVYKMYGI